VIAWVIFVMWTMIIERYLYLKTEHPYRVNQAIANLSARPDRGSWAFEAIRSGVISRLGQRLQSGIPIIRTLAAICPLLGLLGTVTGMIVIFDVMAAMGSSSPRAVAAGVAQATMTTMAGMVGALSGVFPATFLARTTSHFINSLRNDYDFVLAQPVSFLPPLRWAARLPVALVFALVITLTLVYGMQRLIETGEQALTENARIYIPDFVRVEREESVQKKELKPDKLPPPDTAPDTTVIPPASDTDSAGVQVNLSNRGPVDSGLNLQVAGIAGYATQDGDYLPLVKITPIYPRRAQARGLSGWVIVQFTITTTGSVTDVVVVDSSDPIFERSAVQAALKFKYRPRVVDGEPVEVTGVFHSIVFEIEE
jgi:protein TonB